MDVRIGSDAKGDCTVEVGAGSGVEVETKNAELIADGIHAVVEETASKLGVKEVAIRIVDFGALDYVIAARVETAVRAADPGGGRFLAVSVDRKPSERDAPRRSRLYAPGNQPRLLAGIEIHGADCVLLDLEDSVPAAEKAAARILVKHLLSVVGFRREVWVRINALEAGGRDDIREILIGRPHGVCLPKTECARDVLDLSEELLRIEAEYGVEGGTTWIMPILETARGVLHSEEIAAASDRVVALAFGAEDFTRDVGARRSPEALLFARSRIVAGAKAAGLQASDTVYADAEDEAGLVAEASRSRDLGFDGKGVVNPRQIEPVHRVFSPTVAELAQARAIVEAARAAEERGLGAVSLEGRMIDRPVVDRAVRLIKYAGSLGGGGDRYA